MADQGLFDSKELMALTMALANGQGGFVTADLEAVVQWAAQARVQYTLLVLVLNGKMSVHVRDGEVCVGNLEKELAHD